MIIALSIVIGIETIVLVVIALKFTSMRGIIAHHDSQIQQLKESHVRELQARIEADNTLLKQQVDSAAVAAQKQEEATQLALSRQQSAFEEAKQILKSQYEKQLKQQQEDAIQDAKTQKESFERTLASKDERFQQAKDEAEKNLKTQVDAYERTIKEKNDLIASNSANAEKASKELTESYEKRLEQQKADFDKAHAALAERWQKELAALREEFKNSAGKMMEERTEKLDNNNQKQMKELFEPFKEKVKELKEQLEKSQKERASLQTSVTEKLESVQKNAATMVSETNKLTNALKGTNKMQGNWGELQLEQALVDCGLVKDFNFIMQMAITDQTGKAFVTRNHETLIPDATVLLPSRRRVFIDSKMSMTAYMKYLEATDDASRNDALKEHMASIHNHIKNLASKDYPSIGNTAIADSSFEKTIMFMGNEGALMLALTTEPNLWEEAMQNSKVILVSRMSLYPLLWLIHKSWVIDRQSKNQTEIMKQTALLIERLNKFVSVYTNVGDKIFALSNAYRDSLKTLRDSKQSVLNTGKRVGEAIGKETKHIDLLLQQNDNEMESPILDPKETQISISNQLQSGEEKDKNENLDNA